MSVTMTVRLAPELKERLERLAAATHRSRSYLAAEAIREYIDLNEWQIGEVEAAIREADAGDFASEQEVSEVFTRWSANGDSLAAQGIAQSRGRG